MPQTLPKHTPYAAWLAGLTLLPEEADASRGDAARVVAENQAAAARFAFGHASLSPDAAFGAYEAPVMVPQPAQQAQAKPRETAAEWGARMDRQSPRPVKKLRIPAGYVASPAIRAMDRAAAEAGTRYAEAQNAVHAELGITSAPARAGRYGRAA